MFQSLLTVVRHMQFEINELEEALLRDGQVVPVDIRNRLAILRDHARTYDALLELVQMALPRTYSIMFEDEYDMEDAMILNKSAYERGFGHASVYKSKRFQLNDEKGSQFKKSKFKMMGEGNRDSVRNKNIGTLMKDGTPPIN